MNTGTPVPTDWALMGELLCEHRGRAAALAMLVSAALVARIGECPQLVLDICVLGVLGPILSIVDLRLQRLPDAVVLPGAVLVAVQVLIAAFLELNGAGLLLREAFGVVITLALLGVLAALPGDHLGWGDVKVSAGLLAPVCACTSLSALLEAALLAFGSAAVGLVTSRRQAARRALGPYLFLGTLVVVLWHGAR
ncbi:hypothetical protein [Streptacidiphilus sp. MAP5-3]|uniref:hypothetical protein n=1 Tax=unclassified Streptacidiphilus TaxID=2643834 RepID=UPI003519A0C3